MKTLTANDGIVNQKLCSGFGQWHSPNNKRDPKPYETITLADIAGMLKNPQRTAKESAQFFIPSTLLSRVHAEQREKGRFCALWFDADKVEGLTFGDIFSRTLGAIDSDFLLYTTRSATKDNPKSRIILPLLHPVSGTEFIILQTILNNKFEAADITPDRATERAGQVCYLPNEGEYYTSFHRNDAGPFDPGTWVNEIAEIKANLEAEKQALHARQEESRIKAASRMAHGATSPMDAYKAEFSLSLVLTSYGYVQRGDRWLSPNSSSGVPGVITKGQRWISSHSSDAGIGMPNKNGNGTNGDAWDLFVYYSHGGNHDAALRDAGEMFRTVDGDTLTKANQREFMQNKAERETLAGFDIKGDDPLSEFCLNGESETMKKQMLEEKAILGNLALLGQWTMIYSKPNAGKTLLVMWLLIDAITAEIIKGENVYFINADDTHKGLTYKLSLAENYGFMMLSPGYKGFKPEMLAPILKKLVETDKARGKTIILDTVKKFTDLMKKDKSSEFGEAIRQFILHGGSVIGLAHVNKHRSDDGKVVHAGTSDLVDDCDCAYTLDVVTNNMFHGEKTVKFENFKNRGDVALEASYSYDAGEKVTYQERLNSVQSLDKTEIKEAERYRKLEEIFLKNKDVIDEIKNVLIEPMQQKDLIKMVNENSGFGKNKIVRVLKEHQGANMDLFKFWSSERKDKNAVFYTLL